MILDETAQIIASIRRPPHVGGSMCDGSGNCRWCDEPRNAKGMAYELHQAGCRHIARIILTEPA